MSLICSYPFHTMVAAVDIVSAKRAFELGPQSSPIQPAGIPLSTVADPVYIHIINYTLSFHNMNNLTCTCMYLLIRMKILKCYYYYYY